MVAIRQDYRDSLHVSYGPAGALQLLHHRGMLGYQIVPPCTRPHASDLHSKYCNRHNTEPPRSPGTSGTTGEGPCTSLLC